MGFGSPLSVQAALFRIALLASMPRGRGEKRRAKDSLLHPTLTSKQRLDGIPYCGRNTKKNVKQLITGSWNVRTLMDNPKADGLERRTALIGRELARYHVDIAALSETRIANEGHLTEDGGWRLLLLLEWSHE